MYARLCFIVIVLSFTSKVIGQGSITHNAGGVFCATGLNIKVSGKSTIKKQNLVQCPLGSECFHFFATFNASTSLIPASGTITFGQCVSSIFCSAITCSQVQTSLLVYVNATIKKCNTVCCSSYPCSVSQNTEVTSTNRTPPERLSCYQGIKLIGLSNTNFYGEKQCDPGLTCLDMTSLFSFIGLTGSMSVGRCIKSSLCNQSLCNSFKHMVPNNLPVTLGQCSVTCCDTNLCNTPGGNTSATSETTLPFIITNKTTLEPPVSTQTSHRVFCSTGVNIKLSGKSIINNQKLVQCPLGSECFDFTSIVRANFSTTLIYGRTSLRQCVSSLDCGAITCAKVKSYLPHDLAVTMQRCNIKCISPPPLSCGPTHFTASNNLKQFKFPVGQQKYNNSMKCEWNIKTDQPGRVVKILFENFKTQRCCDHLLIIENGRIYKRLGGKSSKRFVITMKTNQVILRFNSDSSINDNGFKFRYYAVQPQ